MLKASEYLEKACLNIEDSERHLKNIADVEEAAAKHVGYAGFFVRVHPERINNNTGVALQIWLHKHGFMAQMTLLPSKLNERLPGEWHIAITPDEESLNGASVNLTTNQLNLC